MYRKKEEGEKGEIGEKRRADMDERDKMKLKQR